MEPRHLFLSFHIIIRLHPLARITVSHFPASLIHSHFEYHIPLDNLWLWSIKINPHGQYNSIGPFSLRQNQVRVVEFFTLLNSCLKKKVKVPANMNGNEKVPCKKCGVSLNLENDKKSKILSSQKNNISKMIKKNFFFFKHVF